MLIRKARRDDCEIIFNWRNDPISKEMFINTEIISFENHLRWYEESLEDPNRYIYIGEIRSERFGVCRFDFDQKTLTTEVSININPVCRGKGLGKALLISSINKFEEEQNPKLVAYVKKKNFASKKLFEYAGFFQSSIHDEIIKYERPVIKISFKKVTSQDSKILYSLLKTRKHNISHFELPSFSSHQKFVDSSPYKHWFLILENEHTKGSFYVQRNNSIGIDLKTPSLQTVREIVNFINSKLIISKALPSQVPPYFFINVAKSNKEMLDILEKIGCESIQVSLKINPSKI